ncbi:DUF4179 domain-containing protein [Lysinibacillus fusiformis]|uniref:DUF4179 domain-containing protein n=1 Tax=Lysinibacillus sp. PWR01 TaxID=3342384 RepID=UPI00372D45AD
MDTRSKLEDKELTQIERFIRETPVEVDLVNRTMDKYESKRNSKQPESFRTHKKMRQRVMMMMTASAAMIFSLVFITGLISPTMAATMKEVPVLSSIFKLAGDLGLKTADEKGLSTKLHTSVTKDGFTLSVSEVVYDGTRVSIAIERPHIENEKETLQERISDIKLFINDVPINSFAPENSNSIGIMMHPGKDNDSAIIEFADLRNQGGRPFPEQFDLTISTTITGIQNPLKIDIPVKNKIEDYVTLQPNVSRDYDNIRFTVKKIELTPITTNITTQIILTDNSKFTLSPIAKDMDVDIFDEQGNKLKLINGNGWNDPNDSDQIIDYRFHPFESIPKTITFKPYIQLYEENQMGVYKLDENGKEMIQYIPELEVTIPINSQK